MEGEFFSLAKPLALLVFALISSQDTHHAALVKRCRGDTQKASAVCQIGRFFGKGPLCPLDVARSNTWVAFRTLAVKLSSQTAMFALVSVASLGPPALQINNPARSSETTMGMNNRSGVCPSRNDL
ncbi:hypothetical protein [Deinococcus marmoris]|uniref:hypothetical protein n=1 Tax=Deinococcus marmoris TaxID=249408 RepID=UPI00158CD7BC|nr:hypothetical protein [Deinococcus marmoris]